MGRQFFGAFCFIIEGMFEDGKSQVPIDELSSQERGKMTEKRIKKWGK